MSDANGPANRPDRVTVPDDGLLVIPEDDTFNQLPSVLVASLRGNFRRDWLLNHSYHCLPLVLGSQLGFVVTSLYDMTIRWDGGDHPDSVTIQIPPAAESIRHNQLATSRFGMGTVTIQNRWMYRTPPGVNLLTVAPPNYWIDGITHLSAMVEADNLRRDFTFNLKITRVAHDIFIPKGTPIGCLLPYPRHYFDRFHLVEARDVLGTEVIDAERATAKAFGHERATIDLHKRDQIGKRYWKGEDVYGNKFADHQHRLDPQEPRRS